MVCRYCGKENGADAKFCQECGKELGYITDNIQVKSGKGNTIRQNIAIIIGGVIIIACVIGALSILNDGSQIKRRDIDDVVKDVTEDMATRTGTEREIANYESAKEIISKVAAKHNGPIFITEGSNEKSLAELNKEKEQEMQLAKAKEAAKESASASETIMSDEDDDSYNNKYILPYSDTKKIKKSDLKGLSATELRLARNEIYARHGRRFQDSSLQEYFDSQDWYYGYIEPEDFVDSEELSDLERKNAKFIKEYEEGK